MREVLKEDAPHIEEMEIDLFPDNCFNARTLEREIGAGIGFVEFDRGELVGYLLGRKTSDLLDILRIGVRPTHRKAGLGSRLLRLAMKTEQRVILTVRKSNQPAIRLYVKFGFKIVAETDHSWIMIWSELGGPVRPPAGALVDHLS